MLLLRRAMKVGLVTGELAQILRLAPIACAHLNAPSLLTFALTRAVKVGLVDGELVLNPSPAQAALSALSLTYAGASGGRALMVEASGDEVGFALGTAFWRAGCTWLPGQLPLNRKSGRFDRRTYRYRHPLMHAHTVHK